jgi:hypothetical protein
MKLLNKPILALVTTKANQPTGFKLGAKRFRVTAILKFWQATTPWWTSQIGADLKFWRVAAAADYENVVIDICYDHRTDQWQLVRKLVG